LILLHLVITGPFSQRIYIELEGTNDCKVLELPSIASCCEQQSSSRTPFGGMLLPATKPNFLRLQHVIASNEV
jgi:hypothetical protein